MTPSRRPSICPCIRPCVLPFTLSNTNISATSKPVAIKFYMKHNFGVGLPALGFEEDGGENWFPWQDISRIDSRWETKQNKTFSPKPQTQSFYIMFVAMYSALLYKS